MGPAGRDDPTGGAGERAVGAGDAAGDEDGDREVREEHPGPVRVGARVVVVVCAGREREVQGELTAGEDGGEAWRRARARTEQRRDGDDPEAHGERGRGDRHRAAGFPVRRDAEHGGADSEQRGARRRRSVGGHGPPR